MVKRGKYQDGMRIKSNLTKSHIPPPMLFKAVFTPFMHEFLNIFAEYN